MRLPINCRRTVPNRNRECLIPGQYLQVRPAEEPEMEPPLSIQDSIHGGNRSFVLETRRCQSFHLASRFSSCTRSWPKYIHALHILSIAAGKHTLLRSFRTATGHWGFFLRQTTSSDSLLSSNCVPRSPKLTGPHGRTSGRKSSGRRLSNCLRSGVLVTMSYNGVQESSKVDIRDQEPAT